MKRLYFYSIFDFLSSEFAKSKQIQNGLKKFCEFEEIQEFMKEYNITKDDLFNIENNYILEIMDSDSELIAEILELSGYIVIDIFYHEEQDLLYYLVIDNKESCNEIIEYLQNIRDEFVSDNIW